MPRVARVVVPGAPHHVTQRGNDHQDVFLVHDDRSVYLELLRTQARLLGLWIEGVCLWSGARGHCGLEVDNGLLDLAAWHERRGGMDWKAAWKAAVKDKAGQDAVRRS